MIKECIADEIIGEITGITLTTSCSDIRGAANDLNNYLFQEIPYPVSKLSRILHGNNDFNERPSLSSVRPCDDVVSEATGAVANFLRYLEVA